MTATYSLELAKELLDELVTRAVAGETISIRTNLGDRIMLKASPRKRAPSPRHAVKPGRAGPLRQSGPELPRPASMQAWLDSIEAIASARSPEAEGAGEFMSRIREEEQE